MGIVNESLYPVQYVVQQLSNCTMSPKKAKPKLNGETM